MARATSKPPARGKPTPVKPQPACGFACRVAGTITNDVSRLSPPDIVFRLGVIASGPEPEGSWLCYVTAKASAPGQSLTVAIGVPPDPGQPPKTDGFGLPLPPSGAASFGPFAARYGEAVSFQEGGGGTVDLIVTAVGFRDRVDFARFS